MGGEWKERVGRYDKGSYASTNEVTGWTKTTRAVRKIRPREWKEHTDTEIREYRRKEKNIETQRHFRFLELMWSGKNKSSPWLALSCRHIYHNSSVIPVWHIASLYTSFHTSSECMHWPCSRPRCISFSLIWIDICVITLRSSTHLFSSLLITINLHDFSPSLPASGASDTAAAASAAFIT